MRSSEMANQMTERQWRRILWLRDRAHWGIIGIGATILPTGITTIAVAYKIAPVWAISTVTAVWLIICSIFSVIAIIAINREEAARLCHQRHVAKIEKRERERVAKEQEAMKEIIAETGYGLGHALWEDAGKIVDAS